MQEVLKAFKHQLLPSEPTQLETKRDNTNKMQCMELPPVSRDVAGVAMHNSQLIALTWKNPYIIGSIFIPSHTFPPAWAVGLSFGLHLAASPVRVHLWKELSFLLICGCLLCVQVCSPKHPHWYEQCVISSENFGIHFSEVCKAWTVLSHLIINTVKRSCTV